MFLVTFMVLSVLSLLYFAVLVLYSGIETSGIWIWMAFTVLFGLLALGSGFYEHHKEKIPLWVPVSVITLCSAGLAVFVALQILIFGSMTKTVPNRLDYLIVLGAKVREDDISSSLKRRLDRTLRFVEEHPETRLVLSGGQGEGEPTTEAQAMAAYLRYNGVDATQLYMEPYATNTKENMICSKALIDAVRAQEKEDREAKKKREQESRMQLDRFLKQAGEEYNVHVTLPHPASRQEVVPDKPLEIGVLTSNFHLYRAMQIGKKCGLNNLTGVASSTDPVLFVHLCVRESIAILKDKFMGNF